MDTKPDIRSLLPSFKTTLKYILKRKQQTMNEISGTGMGVVV